MARLSYVTLHALHFLATCVTAQTSQRCNAGYWYPTESDTYEDLFNASQKLLAWYRYKDYNQTSAQWIDASGNTKHGKSIGSLLNKICKNFTDVRGEVCSVEGLDSNQFFFPSTGYLLPTDYSLCTISRYTSNDTTKQNVVMMSNTANVQWGHWGGRVGIVSLNGWRTPQTSIFPNSSRNTEWLIMCGSRKNINMYANGVDRGTNTLNYQTNWQLQVNNYATYPTLRSDFAIAEIVAFTESLDSSTLKRVADFYADMLNGVVSQNYVGKIFSPRTNICQDCPANYYCDGKNRVRCPNGTVTNSSNPLIGGKDIFDCVGYGVRPPPPPPVYTCMPVNDVRYPLVNGRCDKCYWFGNRCGCDATLTCGPEKNGHCRMVNSVGGGAIQNLTDGTVLYDNSNATGWGYASRYGYNWAGYDFETSRNFVGAIVKGYDNDYNRAQGFQVKVMNSDDFINGGCPGQTCGVWVHTNPSNEGVEYTKNVGFVSMSASGRYGHVGNRNYNLYDPGLISISEFRMFEEASSPFLCPLLLNLPVHTLAEANLIPDPPPYNYSCMPFNDRRFLLNDRKCKRCYKFGWGKCGCDTLMTCGSNNDTLCKLKAKNDRDIRSLYTLYDNDPNTFWNGLFPGERDSSKAWVGYDLERPRKIVGGIVKGSDVFGNFPMYFTAHVGVNMTLERSNVIYTMPFRTPVGYSRDLGIFNLDTIGQYFLLAKSNDWDPYEGFSVWEYRLFEEAHEDMCVDPPADTRNCSSWAMLDLGGEYIDNITFPGIPTLKREIADCLMLLPSNNSFVMLFKQEADTSNITYNESLLYKAATSAALGINDNNVYVMVQSPNQTANSGDSSRRLLQTTSKSTVNVFLVTSDETQLKSLVNEIYTDGYQNRLNTKVSDLNLAYTTVNKNQVMFYDPSTKSYGFINSQTITTPPPPGNNNDRPGGGASFSAASAIPISFWTTAATAGLLIATFGWHRNT